MNIRDIFLNNGQFNWDAINTISNIILVLALVLITGWYAREVKRQTELMVKNQKRSKILDEVRHVLTPAIDHLNSEIEGIRHKKIFWQRYSSGEYGFDYRLRRLFNHPQYRSVRFSFEKSSWALKDILGKFFNLNDMFSSHDSLIDELSEFYVEIEKEIIIPKIKDKLEKMIKEFNEKRDDAYRLKVEKPVSFIGGYIINLEYIIERIPNSNEPHIDFWEENQKELLKFRDTPHIIEIGKKISSKLIQLIELDETILKKLQKIREDYRQEYNFTDNEVEPLKGAL